LSLQPPAAPIGRLRGPAALAWPVPADAAPGPEPSTPPGVQGPVEFLASRIQGLVDAEECAIVAGFGCGDMRELRLVAVPPGRKLKVWHVDADAPPVPSAPGLQVAVVLKSVFRLTAADCPRLHLAYSLALLGRLTDEVAARAMRAMAAQVAPGGEVVLASPAGRVTARSGEELARLAGRAFAAQLWRRTVLDLDGVPCLHATRLAY
jgi:hypothetical protein